MCTEPEKELCQEPEKKPKKELWKEPEKEPNKELWKEPEKELWKEQEKELSKECSPECEFSRLNASVLPGATAPVMKVSRENGINELLHSAPYCITV